MGATVIECDLATSMQDFRNCSRIINTAECYAIHERDYIERRQQMGVALRNKLDVGRAATAVDYLRAQRWRRALAAEIDRRFEDVDIILCGGTTRVAPDYSDRAGIKAFTGRISDGGVQHVGPSGDLGVQRLLERRASAQRAACGPPLRGRARRCGGRRT